MLPSPRTPSSKVFVLLVVTCPRVELSLSFSLFAVNLQSPLNLKSTNDPIAHRTVTDLGHLFMAARTDV